MSELRDAKPAMGYHFSSLLNYKINLLNLTFHDKKYNLLYFGDFIFIDVFCEIKSFASMANFESTTYDVDGVIEL